jgi:hypothetical protein
MFAKKHEVDLRIVLAVCDKEHLGKEYEQGEICFNASEKFYKGEKITEKELELLLNEADSANLFGNKCVDIAIKKGFVSEKGVLLIAGIKHAQIYKM